MRQKHQSHTRVAKLNDLRVIVEECKQRMPEIQDERYRNAEHDKALQHGQQQRLFAALKLACAVVLAYKGRAGLAEGVENIEGYDLHVPCRARRRHDQSAEAVDGCLNDHVRYRKDCALHACRQADAQDVPQASHIYMQLGDVKADIVIRLSQAEEQDHRAYRV